jgi:membrane fusion protein (multidrug efflux system)
MSATGKLSPRLRNTITAAAVFAAVALSYAFMHRGQESTDDATIEAHVVSISPKVSGYVKTLNIIDNQQVKAGDVLLEIDPADYIIKRDRARANLAAAKAASESSGHTLATTQVSAPSNLDAAEAQVKAAEANYDKAVLDLKRMKRLSNEARSREQLDAAVAAEQSAFSNLEDARARLRSAKTAPKTIAAAEANEEQLQAEVKQAEADLATAEKDLSDTKIISPIDGRITKRGVEKGDFVQPGQTLGYLVGNEKWVIADFKETQLQHMQPGQHVVIHIDAFPNTELEGKIDSLQAGTGVRFSAFPPENATGNYVKIVQRVPVKIVFDPAPDPNLPLGPGMSVVPTVYTR